MQANCCIVTWCAIFAAGLTLTDRFATWDHDPWRPGGDYAVSVHHLSE